MRGIVFDADHTLIDFNADAVNAYERLCARCGARADGTGFLAAAYRKWEEHGLHRVDTERVLRGFHEIYREYVADLFSLASQEEPALSGREGEYIGLLSEEGKPLGASLETVARLSERYPIFVATNGLSAMQRGRLRAFAPYVRELFISEELGCIKPDAAFFWEALRSSASSLAMRSSATALNISPALGTSFIPAISTGTDGPASVTRSPL